MSRLTLGPTQSPVQLVLGSLSLCVKWMGCEADNHFHLVPRLRMSYAIPLHTLYAFIVCTERNFTIIGQYHMTIKVIGYDGMDWIAARSFDICVFWS